MATIGSVIESHDLKDNIGQHVIVLYSDGSRRLGKIMHFDEENKKIRIERRKDHFWVPAEDSDVTVYADANNEEQPK